MSAPDIIECPQCFRMFPNRDGTGVCPNGHDTNLSDEDDQEHDDHLRKVTW